MWVQAMREPEIPALSSVLLPFRKKVSASSAISTGKARLPEEIIVTSGVGGVIPKGLMIGTVDQVQVESHGMSLYAVIDPVVDIPAVKDVIIITEFEGQTVEETEEPAQEPEEDAETSEDAQ